MPPCSRRSPPSPKPSSTRWHRCWSWRLPCSYPGAGWCAPSPRRWAVSWRSSPTSSSGRASSLLAMLGAVLALLLHTEIALHLILPMLRWLRHCVATTWELGWLMLAMMSRLWVRSPPRAPSAPRQGFRTADFPRDRHRGRADAAQRRAGHVRAGADVVAARPARATGPGRRSRCQRRPAAPGRSDRRSCPPCRSASRWSASWPAR